MRILREREGRSDFPLEAIAVRMAAADQAVHVVTGCGAPAGALVVDDGARRTSELDPSAELAPVMLPRLAIFRGKGSAYPYCAYYAHALACLGYVFDIVDGEDLASGALDEVDILFMPGGFAIWGIDRCEGVSGADAEVRQFLRQGGSAIGSCGGAFYLSAGRPEWQELAPASPRYTHEYLRSGAGLVAVAMQDDELGRGAAPLVEMPYYHGPIYEAVRAPATVHGHFNSLSLAARMPIDNPLDDERFVREMEARAAILSVASEKGRGVLFSPHPEMGDLVRKYVAFETYVERYLPIRGTPVMEATLDFYRPNAAPSFRLIFNAVQWCASAKGATVAGNGQKLCEQPSAAPQRLQAAILRQLERTDCGDGVARHLLERERRRLTTLATRLDPDTAACDAGMDRMFEDAIAYLADGPSAPSPSQHLLDIELALRLLEASSHRGALATSVRKMETTHD